MSVQDFASLQLDEMTAAIRGRRTKIFLLMEEVRRLRIQERLKVAIDLSSHLICRDFEFFQL